MSHNTKYYRKKLKKTESSKKIDVLFRQQALASENSANITPKQTEKVEASAEIAKLSASTKNCPSTSAGVPSQCDDTHSNHDSSCQKNDLIKSSPGQLLKITTFKN